MVLAILALLWIIVLAPTLFRKFRERQSTESIDTFHRELHLLERAGPRLLARGHGIDATDGCAMNPSTGLPSVSSKPGRPKLVLLPHPSADDPNAVTGAADGAERAAGRARTPRTPGWSAARAGGGSRAGQPGDRGANVYKRRRDLLLGLIGTFLVTAMAGSVHALRPLWVITFLAAVALGGYVLLVQQARRMRAERRATDRLRAQLAEGYAPAHPAQPASEAAQYAAYEADLRAWEEQRVWEEQLDWKSTSVHRPQVAASR